MPRVASSVGVTRFPTPALLAPCGIAARTKVTLTGTLARLVLRSSPRIFEEKRDCSQSKEKRDCSQSTTVCLLTPKHSMLATQHHRRISNVFRQHCTREIWKRHNQPLTISGLLGFLFQKNSGEEIVFEKLRFQTVFRPHLGPHEYATGTARTTPSKKFVSLLRWNFSLLYIYSVFLLVLKLAPVEYATNESSSK